MTAYKRYPTKFEGVFYRQGANPRTGKPERIFYIKFSRGGKAIEEKAGRECHGMSAAKAKNLRVLKIAGKELPRREERARKRAEAERKKAETAGRYDLDRLFKEYLENKGESLKGVVTDRSRYNLHLKPLFGSIEPKAMVHLSVDRLRLKLGKTHSPSTVRNALELLRRIINYGVGRNLIEPLRFKIKLPSSVNNATTEDLNESELKRLLAAIEADTNVDAKAIMLLALYSGMRRGEILKLRWDDIDFNRGFIRIVGPKGGADQTIPLNAAARKVMEAHPRTSEYVFPGEDGGPRKTIQVAARRIRKAAGLPESFRPLHGLRHAFASRLASSGAVDMYVLQKLMTHKSPQMTARYAHLRDDALRRASELAGNLFQTTTKVVKNTST